MYSTTEHMSPPIYCAINRIRYGTQHHTHNNNRAHRAAAQTVAKSHFRICHLPAAPPAASSRVREAAVHSL